VLFYSARGDSSSAKELAKFGFSREKLSAHASGKVLVNQLVSSVSSKSSSPATVRFGSFDAPVILENQSAVNCRFFNDNYVRKLCASLPKETLEQLELLRLAKYSDEDIMVTLNLPLIPPKDLVYSFLGRC
jgi:hypothetical protein